MIFYGAGEHCDDACDAPPPSLWRQIGACLLALAFLAVVYGALVMTGVD